jgi:hypothetical protein
LAASAISRPSSATEPAMPVSIPGTAMPVMPSNPPAAMANGNANGNTQRARRPICAAHRPTATMARM